MGYSAPGNDRLLVQRVTTVNADSKKTSSARGDAALFDAALDYARRGWSIIPVVGKQAATMWKPFQRRRPDEQTLRRLFARSGITGLAAILGRVSGGLAVRDFDDVSAYESWAREFPDDAARQPTVRTSRGYHVFGVLESAAYVTFTDGELRADCGHYVVIPPSIHRSGSIYTWIIPLPGEGIPLPPLPSATTCQKTQDNPNNPTACARPSPTSHDDVENAIARTLPTGPGQRNRRLFDLARELKRFMAKARRDDLRTIVRDWYRRALPNISTKAFSDSWCDFVVAWRKVKCPAGASLHAALVAADQQQAPSCLADYDGDLRRLGALCWQLQLRWGKRPFPLGCREAGNLLGISPMKAWRLLQTLRFDRVVHRVKKGSKASKRVSEWRFCDPEKAEQPR
jgi:hypothetical protein